ncbi:hypothetical protein CLV62_14427 [Dysgonomonas alginatilytica]|uniref:DUF5683 domain-containing protein n=2 Tax=Dysgonomonas alginatilytica TaxID=1605892 RepID=A0A2V3PKD8_9BACT|nr:hypothetical protein CLV62_14427 [Dysgonomonas alginatilytica]
MIRLTFFIALFLFYLPCIYIHADNPILTSEKLKPDWLVNNLPVPTNNSFYYQRVQAEAISLDNARQAAFKQLVNYIDQTNNVKITGDIVTRSSSQKNNTGINESINNEYIYTYKIESEIMQLRFRKIDEYWELIKSAEGHQLYRYHSLYAISNNFENTNFDNVSFTYKYGGHALWRSAIVPGYGQIYKGNVTKGVCIIGGEVLFIGGIIFTENSRANYRRKAKETYDINKIRTYTDKADNYETARNIFIGGAVALYIYNLIDAVATNGRKKTLVSKNIHFSPTVTSEYRGVLLNINF